MLTSHHHYLLLQITRMAEAGMLLVDEVRDDLLTPWEHDHDSLEFKTTAQYLHGLAGRLEDCKRISLSLVYGKARMGDEVDPVR